MTNSPWRSRVPPSAFVLAMLAALPLSAFAAGMGKAQVKSYLGQPLRADIELFSDHDEKPGAACFRLVPPVDHAPETEDLIRASFTVETSASGATTLHLLSAQPVNEPVVRAHIRMDCGNTQLVRRYVFLLDPPREEPQQKTPPLTAAPEVRSAPEPGSIAPAKPSGRQPSANTVAAQRTAPPPSGDTSAAAPVATKGRLPKASANRRRTQQDRISINTMAERAGEFAERTPNLKMSPSLDLSRLLPEQAPQRDAILALERRLNDFTSAPETYELTPEQRLQKMLGLLGEAQAIAQQLSAAVVLPTRTELPSPSADPLLASGTAVPPVKVPEKPVANAPIPTTSETPLLAQLALIALALGALGGGGFAWWQKWRDGSPPRKLSLSGHETKSGPQTPADPLVEKAAAGTLRLDGNNIFRSPAHPDPVAGTPAGRDLLHQSIAEISVVHGIEDEFDDPFTAHLEAAEIMICFGRFKEAAAEISGFIEQTPECGLRPRLALLSIFQRGQMKSDFDLLVSSMVQRFNVALPEWGPQQPIPESSRNLDAFPHVLARISELWETDQCLAYVEHLTTDTRQGTRTGFDLDAAEEIALLEAMLRLRANDPNRQTG